MKEANRKTEAGVCSERIRYMPSDFARSALFYLQEAGMIRGSQPYTCSFGEERQDSCLFLMAEEGQGEFFYEGIGYSLQKGSVVFIKCEKDSACSMEAAKESADGGSWELLWCRFAGMSLTGIFRKYRDCGGQPVFLPEAPSFYREVMGRLHALADSSDEVRDMRINQELNGLFTLLMEETGYQKNIVVQKSSEIGKVKKYLDEHYMEKITLDSLEEHFGISKYYLTKLFRENYDRTIITYVLEKRIAKAKVLLRTTDMAVEEVGAAVGIENMNYFCRTFRKLEGKSPGQFRRRE